MDEQVEATAAAEHPAAAVEHPAISESKGVPTFYGKRIEEISEVLDKAHRQLLRKLTGVQAMMRDLPPGDVMMIRGHPVSYITKNQMLKHLREIITKEALLLLPPDMKAVEFIEGNKVMVTIVFGVADAETGYALKRTYRELATDSGDSGISLASGKAFRLFLQHTFNFTMSDEHDASDADPEMIPSAEVMANGPLEDIIQALRLKASTSIAKVGADKALKRIKEKGQFVTTTDPEQMSAQECLTVISAAMDVVGVGASTKDKLRRVVDQADHRAGSEGKGGE